MGYKSFKNLGNKIYTEFKHAYVKRVMTKRYRKKINNTVSFTKEQLNAMKEFYAPYCKFDTVSHLLYLQSTGVFSEKFLPTEVYYNYVDEYFNNIKEARFLDNKCYYKKLFPGMNQPIGVVAKIGKNWFDENDNIISYEKVKEIVANQDELFLKAAVESCGGRGVSYISKEKGDMVEQFENFKCNVDFIAQKPIKQHKNMSYVNESSVNTIRVISMLNEDGVKIYSIVVRAGQKGDKCDNSTAGGVSIGVDENGNLKEYGYDAKGNRWNVHPTNGFKFGGHPLPSFDKIKEFVKKAHPMVPHFRLVSWDISVEENGEPILLETNLCQGSLDLHQFNNGPLFGDDTKKILDEVFGK